MFGCLLSSCVSSPASLIILPIPREPAAPTPISDSQDAGTTSFRGRGDHDIASVNESTMSMPRWVVWIATVGIRKAYENIMKLKASVREWPYRRRVAAGEQDIEQTSTGNVS